MISAKYVTRGCLADLEEEDREKCKRDKIKCEVTEASNIVGANDIVVKNFTCVECDSDTDDRCRTHPEHEDFKGKICDRIDSTEISGCYLSIVSGIFCSILN